MIKYTGNSVKIYFLVRFLCPFFALAIFDRTLFIVPTTKSDEFSEKFQNLDL